MRPRQRRSRFSRRKVDEMRISAVKTTNWMAFAGVQSVTLPAGPIALFGRYVENSRRSNWSGKSAWLEAIRFVITGAHRKRTDDACITYGAERMEVELTMSTGLVATRSRPRGGPTVLRVVDPVNLPGVMLEREAAEQHLARLIRLPLNDFDNTSWFGQGDVQALCAKTSGVRREVFARWLELDMWERMGKRAQTAAREARVRLEVARQASSGAAPRPQEAIDLDRARLKSLRMHLEATNDQMTAHLEGLRESQRQLVTLASRKADADAAVVNGRAIREQLQALPAATPAAMIAQLEEEKTTEHAAMMVAEGALTEVRQLLAGQFSGKCPVTCESCPVAEEVSGKRAAFVERSKVATTERNRARDVLTALGAKLLGIKQTEAERTRLVTRMNDAIQRARDTRKAYDEILATVNVAEHENEQNREYFIAERDQSAEQLRENARLTGQLDEEERQAALYASREVARVKAIETAESEARVAQLVSRALGGSGIPARIAAVSLSGLEERANGLLAGLGLSFTLTWERELADPAPACGECGHIYEKKTRAKDCPACGTPRGRKKSDELDVLVDDGSGDVEDVREKSGGAKVLVASAIRLAGGMMLRERRGSPFEVAFIDEPFGELDLENRDALARTFCGLLSTVGLEQAFVVSHDAQLLAGFPSKLVVTREGNTSRIELET